MRFTFVYFFLLRYVLKVELILFVQWILLCYIFNFQGFIFIAIHKQNCFLQKIILT